MTVIGSAPRTYRNVIIAARAVGDALLCAGRWFAFIIVAIIYGCGMLWMAAVDLIEKWKAKRDAATGEKR